jgi:hypothetical protein
MRAGLEPMILSSALAMTMSPYRIEKFSRKGANAQR